MAHKRKSCSIQEKNEIIQAIESGDSKTSVAIKYNRQRSTISTIWKNREQIKLLFQQGLSSQKKIKRHKFQEVDQPLLQFINQTPEKQTGEALAMQAQQYAENLGYSKDDVEKINTNWVNRFKTRYGLSQKKRETRIVENLDVEINVMQQLQFENIDHFEHQQQLQLESQQQQLQLENGNQSKEQQLQEIQQLQLQQQSDNNDSVGQILQIEKINSPEQQQQQQQQNQQQQQQVKNNIDSSEQLQQEKQFKNYQQQQQQQKQRENNIGSNNLGNSSPRLTLPPTFTEVFRSIEVLERFFKNQQDVGGKILGELDAMKKVVYQNQLESIIQ